MALITIVIADTQQGPSLLVFTEPKMPTNVLEGSPTPAQIAAATMLNAVRDGAQAPAEPSRIITLN